MIEHTKKKVIILGAGIGGLTVAHELIRSEKNYSIEIYERNPVIGGMARSGFKLRNGVKLPTEYCWRIYGPNYDNLRDILKQIPLKDDPTQTVHDNLINISDYMVADQNTILYMNNGVKTLLDIRYAFKKVPFKQKIQVLSKIVYCFLISTTRLNEMDKLAWSEYIDPHNTLSHDIRKYVIDIMGPYLGADARTVNVTSVAKTLESFKAFNKPLSVMNGPTSLAWFEHWQFYLESQGVQFHFNTAVTDVLIDTDTVTGIRLQDDNVIAGDFFICGLPVESVVKLPSLRIEGIEELAKKGHQLMVSIQLYFNKKIELRNQHTAMYIPDSPWQLVIEPQGAIWNQTYLDVEDFWSIGLCDHVRPGRLIQKPFIECTHEEIQKEVWHQITTSELGKHLSLESVQVIDSNVWDSYQLKGNSLETSEPKFSTNKGTYFLRPKNQSCYQNFYFATGYTQTETDMFEMESAAESGKRTAQLIEPSVKVFPCDRPIAFAPYRWLDSQLAQFNLFQKFPFFWFLLGLPVSIVFTSVVYLYKVSHKIISEN